MLRVPIYMARPNMTLAVPIRHPKRIDTLLLNKGAKIDGPAIEHLREIGIRELWIEIPELGFLAGYVSPAVQASCAATATALDGVFSTVRTEAMGKIDFFPVRRAVSDLLESITSNPMAALYISELGMDDEALQHAGNVCFLSLLMGLKLEGYLIHQRARLSPSLAREVTPLGMGALLHDIGMQKLAAPIVQRWRKDFDETDVEWQRHVALGYEIVRGEIEPSAAAVVLHHHQKFDGTGFPCEREFARKLRAPAGSKIHIFPRIAAVADLFDRLRWQKAVRIPGEPRRPAMPIVRVLNELRSGAFARAIDPVILKALVHVVPAYGPGTVVTLSNGVEGVVTDWTPDDPCRPQVESLGDLSRGWNSRPNVERFDLRLRRDLTVISAEGFDVSNDNFEIAYPGEFDLGLFFKSLVNAAVPLPASDKAA